MEEMILTTKRTPIEIALDIDESGHTTLRKLYDWLQLDKSNYSRWVKQNVFENPFAINGEDYSSSKTSEQKGRGNYAQDYIITASFAKKLAMLTKTERGEEARDYFIKIEKALVKVMNGEPKNDLITIENLIANPDFAIKLLTELKEQKQKNEELEQKNEELVEENQIQAQQIAEMNPKVSYYDTVLTCVDAVPITVIAKDYGWTAQAMNDFLYKNHVQYKLRDTWLLYSEHQSKGYTKTSTHVIKGKNGYNFSKIHTCWTQKGRLFIYELMKKNGYLPLIEQEDSQAVLTDEENRGIDSTSER